MSTYTEYFPLGVVDPFPAPPDRPAEGTGDDQGDHETPSPSPSASATPSTAPTSAGAAPSDEAPSTYPTEPAAPVDTLPQTSGPDPWLALTFVLVAVLAVVGGILMRRGARRLGHR